MCMDNLIDEPTDQTTAWKVMKLNNGEWRTPCLRQKPVDNKLVAKGEPNIKNKSLAGGAIHCFKSHTDAWRYVLYGVREHIFKVRGSGLVAHNKDQIAFREVEFVENLDDVTIEVLGGQRQAKKSE